MLETPKLRDHIAAPRGDIEIDVLIHMPSSPDFYRHNIQKRRPVVIRGAVHHWQAFLLWRKESYLRTNFGSADFSAHVEVMEWNCTFPCSENNSMSLVEFLDRSQDDPIYLESDCSESKILYDTVIPDCLSCEEISGSIRSTTIFMSRGNRKTCIFHDVNEIFQTAISGTMTILLFNSSQFNQMETPMDMSAVDLSKYALPCGSHCGSVTLGPGDELYIPQSWWYLVQSSGHLAIGFSIRWSPFMYGPRVLQEGLMKDEATARVEILDQMSEKTPIEIACQSHQKTMTEVLRGCNFSGLAVLKPAKKLTDKVLASGYESKTRDILHAGVLLCAAELFIRRPYSNMLVTTRLYYMAAACIVP